MIVFTRSDDWQQLRTRLVHRGASVGFVPTMGALHEGHQQLMKRAAAENDLCLASVFVNPTQFNDPNDLLNYPRTLQHDIDRAEQAGCDMLFLPTVNELYTGEPVANKVDYGVLTNTLEGAARAGHFDGVVTIVRKLLSALQPDVLYLGEKDFQQLAVVSELVKREALPARVSGCALVRDENGLALSSRNARLSVEGKQHAHQGHRALRLMREVALSHTPQSLADLGMDLLRQAKGLHPEYVAVVNEQTFQTDAAYLPGCAYRALMAFSVEGVRLIDNEQMIKG